MLNATVIGRLMQRHTWRFGDPTGTLVLTYPQTILPAVSGHPFVRARGGGVWVATYAGVRGDWERQSERGDPDGMGRINEQAGRCTIPHARFQTDYLTLRGLLKREGAVATWEGVHVQLDAIREDAWQDCTVIDFTRQGTG